MTEPTKPPRKPLITANLVTLARLVPMPLLAWWIYTKQIEIALVVGTIVACTDFVDGYLARKQGPTVFGGLLDPIADKVFVALIYLSFADLGAIPAWACALMFVREFLVTALRSAYERRGLSMKTSYLAKVKTWTQMQGIGVLMLFPMLAEDVVTWVLWIGVAVPLVAMALLYAIKKKFWKGALVMSGSFLFLAAIESRHDPELFGNAVMVMIVLLTWVSGVDYLVGAFRKLTNFGRQDFVRVLSAITLPVMIFLVAKESATTPWPLLLILATELAVGGLDNLLSHHQKASGALMWGLRTGGISLLLGAALLVGGETSMPTHATWLAVFAAALSTTGVFWEFWRGRDYYLEARLRDKASGSPRAMLRTQSSG